MTTSDYRPIACAAYSDLEVLILRAGEIRLRLRDSGDLVRGVPRDLRTHAGVEYLLVYTPDGGEREVRLDAFELLDPDAREGE